jgi:hypothetical protein
MSEQKDQTASQPAKPPRYEPPQLIRWGTLRELTEGGGGSRREPVTGRRTRF